MQLKPKFSLSALSVLLISILSVISTQAQMFAPGKQSEPITWKADAHMTSARDGVVTITADIDKGWHLYGLDMPEDGPQATSITFPATEGITFNGNVTADRKPIVKQDPMFGTDVNFWEHKVVFTQKFRLTKKDVKTIRCNVSFMGCNDQTCLPPKKKELTTDIAPLKK